MITDDDRAAMTAYVCRAAVETDPNGTLMLHYFATHRELGARQEREAVVAFVERYPTLDWAIGKAMRSLAIAIAARNHREG